MTVPATSPEPETCQEDIWDGHYKMTCGRTLGPDRRCGTHFLAPAPVRVADTGEAAPAWLDKLADASLSAMQNQGRPAAASPVTPGAGDGMSKSSVHGATPPGTADGPAADDYRIADAAEQPITARFRRRLEVAEDRAYRTQGSRDAAKIRLNATDAREILAALAARDGEVRQLRNQLAHVLAALEVRDQRGHGLPGADRRDPPAR